MRARTSYHKPKLTWRRRRLHRARQSWARCLVHSRDAATLREDCGRTPSLRCASRPGRHDTDLRARKLPDRLRAVRRRRTHTASASRCPKRARSSRQLNDPLIAIRIAWLPKAPRPFRHQLPSIAPKQHFLTVDLTVKLARPGTELPIFKCLRLLETIEWE